MYRNYKITGDGTPKYDGSYKVAPKRRFERNTEEWDKRLSGAKQPYLRRRRINQQNNEKFTLKVYHIIYLLIFLGVVGIVQSYNKTDFEKVPNNTNIVGKAIGVQDFNITLNNAIIEPGNTSSQGSNFLYVDLSIENISRDVRYVSMYDIILIDKDGKNLELSYSDFENENSAKEITGRSEVQCKTGFKVPIGYIGELELLFNNKHVINLNIN
ncbi:MAG: DUF4352 domain-containing protein [Romboutsia sp.]|uniref:DUF4352 domain-containing protein n=1 Tax=Romboutsia sp. TaxID=1965302 RepID=UPI003F40BC76